MNSKERFNDLWSDYLEGDLDAEGLEELRSLILDDREKLTAAVHDFQIHRLLGLQAEDSMERHEAFVQDTMKKVTLPGEDFVHRVMEQVPSEDRRPFIRRIPRWALATAASIALLMGITFFQEESPRWVATITGMNGALQWTGDGGRVVRDLKSGTRLPGGTMEGLAPFSWVELQFLDGSTVSLSGDCMLTFSDLGRKALHLKKGSVSANVKPQPPGKPMSIQTPSALIEVVGTRFEVEAAQASTLVDVRQGSVRVERLSDGAKVNVPAHHQLVAEAGQMLRPRPAPAAVKHWVSRLELGSERTLGRWQAGRQGKPAALGTVPYRTESGMTIHAVGLGVSRCDGPAVILHPDSRLRFQGTLMPPHPIWFGITVRNADGDFAGRFQTILKANHFSGKEDFEVILSLEDFHLDPSLNSMRDGLPDSPIHLVVESLWCHSLDKPAGLEIHEAAILANDPKP